MSIFFTGNSHYKRGITYHIGYNTPVTVNFSMKVAKKYMLTKENDKYLHLLCEKLQINNFSHNSWNEFILAIQNGATVDKEYEITPATHMWVSMDLPFRYAEVLAYSYRKHLTRVFRRMLKYNLTNIDFLAQHVVDRVNTDFYKYFGRKLE